MNSPLQTLARSIRGRDTMRDVEITSEPVELYKILKFEGLVSSGGEAKTVVANGRVLVNGEIETRKRKKIVSGDVIEFRDEKIRIRLISEPGTGRESPDKD
jgi:ribosome-associated protein